MPKVPPEIAFKNHISDELLRRFKHDTLKYSALEQGGIQPSDADVQITNRIRQVGDIVGVMLLDHIVFNRKEYFSFLEGGLM